MLYGSETWCLKENEMAILRRTERAMVRAKCGVKLRDRRSTEDLREMLGLEEPLELRARANGVRWYGHVLRKDDEHVLRKAMEFELDAKRKRGRPKKMWQRQVGEDSALVGLRKDDAQDRGRWRDGVRRLALGAGLSD